MSSIASFDQTQLLAVRTEAGVVYLCPSRLQRLRLQWTFRHFHVLSPQLLSRYDRRLIERLTESAAVSPSLPVDSNAILGVVEMPKAQSRAHAPVRGLSKREDPMPRWGSLRGITAAAIGVVVFLVAIHAIQRTSPALPVAQASENQPAPIMQPVATSLPVAATPPSNPAVAKPRPLGLTQPPPTVATNSPEPVVDPAPATFAEAVPGERRLVTELPQGHFARPVVAQQSPVGEVQLKALIAPDGSVEQVTVVSGDPKLAEASIRAVRQWHYSPYQVQGAPTEEETRIKMNFFGPDAVSIASVASQP